MLIVTIANCVIVGAIFLLGASSFEGSSASVGFSTASASLSESSTFLVWFLIGGLTPSSPYIFWINVLLPS